MKYYSARVTVESDGRLSASVDGMEVHTWADDAASLKANLLEAIRLHTEDDDGGITIDLDYGGQRPHSPNDDFVQHFGKNDSRIREMTAVIDAARRQGIDPTLIEIARARLVFDS